MNRCCICAADLPDDDRARKRRKSRKCIDCRNRHRRKRKLEDPVIRLKERMYDWCHKHGISSNRSLWAEQSIREALERWDHKCVVSGETNMERLTLTTFAEPSIYLDETQLVLVSTEVARQIALAPDRELAFPDEVRRRMVTGEANHL